MDHQFGPDSLTAATEYIEANWTDIRPKSLQESRTAEQRTA